MMKFNYFFLVTLAFFAFASCQASTGTLEYDEAFFNNPNTTVTIKGIFEQDGKVKAFVIGSQAATTEDPQIKKTIIEANTTLSEYKHNDAELFSRKVLTGNVIVGDNLYPFSEPYVAQQKILYVSKGETQQADNAPLGQWYTVYKVLHYLRADDTVYVMKTPLYEQKKIEEARSTGQQKRYCVGEKDVISKWKRKTEHTIHVYTVTDVYSILWQRKLDGSEEQKVSEEL